MFEREVRLNTPFPRTSIVPLLKLLATNVFVIESIAVDDKLQLLDDKYKIPTGKVGKSPTGQLFNDKYPSDVGNAIVENKENEVLLLKDIVTIVFGSDSGKYCKLLLSNKNSVSPDGKDNGNVVIKLLEQFKYDNVNGKFTVDILLEEQSI